MKDSLLIGSAASSIGFLYISNDNQVFNISSVSCSFKMISKIKCVGDVFSFIDYLVYNLKVENF